MKRAKTIRVRVLVPTIPYDDPVASGDVTFGDSEGDPSVPGGLQYLPPYVDDVVVHDGKIEITEELSRDEWQRVEEALIEEACEREEHELVMGEDY